MSDQFQTSDHPTSQDLQNVTFSQASEAGLTHSNWLVGLREEKYGQEAALASHSVLPDRAEELRMRGTYGPLFGGSSPSADLQQSLASRLRQAMDVNGSPEYSMTWKRWDMFAREPICRLAALARPIEGSDFSGWPSPQAGTPAQKGYNEAGNTDNGRKTVALIAGWHTPKSPTGGTGTFESLMARGKFRKLEEQASLADMDFGVSSTTSTAATTGGGPLNPEHSRWLMGYPSEWLSCVDWEMLSSRKSQQSF